VAAQTVLAALACSLHMRRADTPPWGGTKEYEMQIVSNRLTRLALAAPLLAALAACSVAQGEGSPEPGETGEGSGLAAAPEAVETAHAAEQMSLTSAAVFVELPPVAQLAEGQAIADPSVYRAIEELDDEAMFREANAVTTNLAANGRIALPLKGLAE
jgi:hypothetical protein